MDQPETLVTVTAGTAGIYGVVDVAGIAGIAGLTVKKPQPLIHTCQSTPAFVVSLTTAAVRFTVAFVWICAGSEGMKPTEETVVNGLISMGLLELMLTDGSATEVATIVTVVSVVAGGAVYVAVAPLTVWAGTNQPQLPGTVLLHCAVQVTPPGGTSFVTVAMTEACVVGVIVTGASCSHARDGGAATTVMRAIAGFEGVDAGEDAVIVTRPPAGTEEGAV